MTLLQELKFERDSGPSWFWRHPPLDRYPHISQRPAIPKQKGYRPPVHFTDEQVRQIRAENGLLKDIAAKYGATISWIWKVRHGQKRANA